MTSSKIKGDYQTPLYFAENIVKKVKTEMNYKPKVIYEPTCGIGSFIEAVNNLFSRSLIIGNELNKEYVKRVKEIRSKNNNSFNVYNNNYFEWDGPQEVNKFNRNDLLIIGNPPWVTNSYLSTQNSNNLPKKSNMKGLKGYDAITGSSNFDIGEYIIIDLILKYKEFDPLIVMICKTSVMYNIFQYLYQNNIPAEYMVAEEIDAKEIFNVSVGASVFYLKLNNKSNTLSTINIKSIDGDLYTSGYIDGNFYTKISEDAKKIDGQTEFTWRQGIKHDLSKVMELKIDNNNQYINGYKEKLDIENRRVFPLVKSSQMKQFIKKDYDRFVIVTQNKLKEDTNYIENESPKLWEYLNINKEKFEARKSSIYKNSPPFSMFGIGDYTWKPYKVAVSGFYKKPIFSLLLSDKPVMLDDTSYYLGFDDYDYAYVVMLILNSEPVQLFLSNIANLNAKRPYTKKVLERISLSMALSLMDYNTFKKAERELGLESYLTEKIFNEVKNNIQSMQLSLF